MTTLGEVGWILFSKDTTVWDFTRSCAYHESNFAENDSACIQESSFIGGLKVSHWAKNISWMQQTRTWETLRKSSIRKQLPIVTQFTFFRSSHQSSHQFIIHFPYSNSFKWSPSLLALLPACWSSHLQLPLLPRQRNEQTLMSTSVTTATSLATVC